MPEFVNRLKTFFSSSSIGREDEFSAQSKDHSHLTLIVVGVIVILTISGITVFALQYFSATIPTKIQVNAPQGLSVTPSSLSLVMDNGTSVSTNLELTNTGANTLTVTGVIIYGGINATYFAAVLNDTGVQIPAHETVNSMLTLSSAPGTPQGLYSGYVNITATAP